MLINNYHKGVLDVSFDGLIKRIEVEKVVDDSQDDLYPRYYRFIRFTTYSGEVLEVSCTSDTPKELNRVEG